LLHVIENLKTTEGTSAQQSERTAAYKMMESAHYTGQSVRYIIDDVISTHQGGYNKLARTRLIPDEARRINQFLKE
jgi:hypothetical protein